MTGQDAGHDHGHDGPFSANASTKTHHAYRVEEWGYVDVPATDLMTGGRLLLYPSVIDRGYFTLRSVGDRLSFQAGGYIGVIPLNERVTIEVAPRVPLRNLSRMLRLTEQALVAIEGTVRSYEREPEMHPSLVHIYARAIAAGVDEITLRGLSRDYVQKKEITAFPHGRFLMSETVQSQRSKGVSHKVSTSWYQRTVDNAPNQCIKYVIWFLARHHHDLMGSKSTKESRAALQALNRAYAVFDGVELDLYRRFLLDPVVAGSRPLPLLRSYYRSTLELSAAIIRQQGVSLDRESGDLGLPSIVVNMADVFESYLRNVLVQRAIEDQWQLAILDGNRKPPGGGEKLLFDSGSDTKATPDIVFADTRGDARAYPMLLEIKYKPSDRSLDRDDLNQAISYGVSFRCPCVVLVRPRSAGAKGPQVGLSALGRVSTMDVYQYVYDLGADDVLMEERAFTTSVKALADATQVPA